MNVTEADQGLRLDIFLYNFFKREKMLMSRTVLKKIIQKGLVKSNLSGHTLKPHYKVKIGEIFYINIPDKPVQELVSQDIALKIVYEDDNLLIVDKPAGLVVHPGAGNSDNTLVNALLFHVKKLSDININRPGIVHRLDKDTSGLLAVAKDNATHLNLAEQFKQHTVKRKYAAIVEGETEFDHGIIDIPVKRDKYNFKKMSVGFSKDAKFAKTSYKTIKRQNGFSLLELEPYTGRTHQLRVHLLYLGHPILGDKKYANMKGFPRLFLHAKTLGLIHPVKNKFIEFESELPEEFTLFLKRER